VIGQSLLALVGDALLPAGLYGYQIIDVAPGTRFGRPHVELTFQNGFGAFVVWIAPRDLDTGFYRESVHFRIGYFGEPSDKDGFRVVDRLFQLVLQRESALTAVQLSGWNVGISDGLIPSGDTLLVRVTLRCNENCPFCQIDEFTPNLATTDEAIEHSVREASRLGLAWIAFTGGEPMLVPSLPRWVTLAHELGLKEQVMTNALAPSKVDLWDRFRDSEGRPDLPDSLCISLHTRHPDRTKGPGCSDCVYDDRCIGVWRRYADRFGFDEFVPVK
jgi:hypothetical protein